MLTLHLSNRFEILADELALRLEAAARAPGGNPLAADEVIVPSAAITRRLIVDLARRDGICANIRFSYLAGWLWAQSARLPLGLPPTSPFEPELLAWRLFDAFADDACTGAHPRLAAWLAQSDGVMRLELAARVAALFDQYLTYRPEWLATWAAGGEVALGTGDAGAAADQRWQAALWRRVAAATGHDGRAPALALLAALDARGIGLAGTGLLPAAAHVFCLPTMPPVHLQLLQRLGQHIDLHVYALNPSREFWFDVADARRLAALAARGQAQHAESGNRLLAGWGRQAQSQLGLLVDASGDAFVEEEHYVASGRPTLLGALQDAVLELRELEPGSLALADGDRSLEVHVCHSLTRELEVLHDRLLGLFAGPDAPQPADVLVVTPDLDAAAPLIDAVFGTAPRERHLPYAITGRARAAVNAPARVLLDLLALCASRFAVSAVFGLLQQPAVARRFGLAEDELDRVREWIVQSGIHWALDGGHRARFDVPAEARHSLADGLDRLFLGYALPANAQAPFEDRLPAGDAEGSGALALGAFWRFVDALRALHERTAEPLPATAWPALLAGALADFVEPADAELEDRREVDAVLEALADQWTRSALAQPLSLDVVLAALQRALDDPARGGVPTGVVTFASMGALRNVPLRVVCAIGLDDGAFPTAARPPEFDLMALAPRRGDRQRRLDERNLFLDLLLAARDVVHLSYAGRSVRDNAPRPPSVLVAELLETVLPAIAPAPADAAARERARSRLVVEHPLQPFSAAAFEVAGPEPRVRSFQREYADALRQNLARPPVAAADLVALDDEADDDTPVSAAARPFFAIPLAAAPAEWREVPVERLAAFFRNPGRFLLERRLGLALRRAEDELQDDEPFLLDDHGGAPLVERLLPALLEGLPLEAARRLALAGTEVPVGGFGQRFLERTLNALQDFAAQVREHTTQPVLGPHASSVVVHVDGEPWHVQAAFADLRPRGLLRHRYAQRSPLDYVAGWIPHLMLCATAPAGVAPITTGIARDGRWFLDECDSPQAVLQTLVSLYARGLREPLAFFPRSSWAWFEGGESLAKARAEFRPGPFKPYAEGADAAVALALRGLPDPLAAPASAFTDIARTVYAPLRDCLELE